MNAALLHRHTNDLRQQRFGNQTSFGMTRSRGRERAAVASDEMFPVAIVKRGRAAKLFQNLQCRIDPLIAALTFQPRKVLGRDPPADLAHPGTQLSGRQLAREYGQDQIEQRAVSLRENLFRLSRESVDRVRLAKAGLGSGLMHEPVALEA